MAVFYNQATLSYNGRNINSNIVSGEVVQIIAGDKTAATPTYEQGDIKSFVINLRNTGATEVSGLTVTDNLGAYEYLEAPVYPLEYIDGSIKYYINGALQAPPAVTPPLTISGISIPAGGDAVIVYEARTTEFAPLGDGESVTNTATVSGGGLSEDVVLDETITPAAVSNLSVIKSVTPETIPENGRLTYTFRILNSGSQAVPINTNLYVADTFNPILSDLSVTLNGTALVQPTGYTYDTATGDFRTVPGIISVPAADNTQDPTTGAWSVTPGVTTLQVSGTV